MPPKFKRFAIESTLEYVADNWNVSLIGSEPLRTKTDTDIVNIRSGFKDINGVAQTIAQVVAGPTDEFEATITKDEVVGSKNGRDAAANALDRYYTRLFIRLPESPSVQQVQPLGPPISQLKGRFFASSIAADALQVAGFALQWGVRDQEIVESFFTASGRVIDTVQRLVRPWTFVQPYRADLSVDGGLFRVMARNPRLPGDPQDPPDLEVTFAQLRQEWIQIRVRKTQKYGTVTLIGMVTPASAGLLPQPDPLKTGIGELFIQGTQTERDMSETFAPTGEVLSRVETVSIYAMPAHFMLSQEKTTYSVLGDGAGLTMEARETIVNTWEPIAIDTTGPVQQSKQTAQFVTREGFDEENVFRTLQTDETGFAYDEDGFETGQTTKTRKWDPDAVQFGFGTGNLVDSELTVKILRDAGSLLVEQITEKYVYQEVTTPGFGTVRRPVLQSRDTQTQGGHRPGGPGRARPLRTQTPEGRQSPGGSERITLVNTISGDSDAVNVEEQDLNLNANDLAHIMQQFIKSSNVWQYEVSFRGVAMPQLRKGMYLRITGVPSEILGTKIILPILLVTEINYEYDNSTNKPTSKMQVRCFGWSTT